MRSVFSIVPLLPLREAYSRSLRKCRNWAGSAVLRSARFAPLNGVDERLLRFRGVTPAPDPDPFVLLQVFVMGEEVLDLLPDDLGQILGPANLRIIREGRIERDGQQFLVAAMLVLEEQHRDRPRADH